MIYCLLFVPDRYVTVEETPFIEFIDKLDGVEVSLTEEDIWGSLARQNAVLLSMRDTMLKPENITKIRDLAMVIRKTIITDLSVDQADDLACMIQEAGIEVNQLVVRPDLVTYDVEGYMIPDIDAISELIDSLAP